MKSIHNILAIVALLPSIVIAAVPGQVNFQGVLLDTASQVVTGSVNFDFALFDAATGGTQLWTESQIGVTVTAGMYSVALGSVTPLTTEILSGGAVYLEVTVAGEILSPRQRLLAVPYALEAASVAGVSGTFIQQIFKNFDYDGQAPANDDPREGITDTDGDGLANFIDPDNDNDGISDGTEISNGTDINLVTPAISGFSGPWESTFEALPLFGQPNAVTVTGTNFVTGLSVQVGPENPVPQNVTSTSFDITVGTNQVEGPAIVTVTNINTELATSSLTFTLVIPTITGFSGPWESTPEALPLFGQPNAVTVAGTNFLTGLSVQVGPENPVPQNVTSTSFDITVGTNQVLGPAVVTVTNPNTAIATSSLSFAENIIDVLVFVSSATQANALSQTAATADAFCAQAATNAGLPGTFVAWYSDLTREARDVLPADFRIWRRFDSQLVASDLADLTDGSIGAAISLDEFGNTQNTVVATNTTGSGLRFSNNCIVGSAGALGQSTLTSSGWSFTGSASCTTAAPYYCFQIDE